MTFEAPVQPIPARRRGAVGVLVAIVLVATLLVWMPWSRPPGSGASPQPAAAVVATPAAATSQPTPAQPEPTPLRTPYQPPLGADLVRYMPFVSVPTLDQFRPRWSVVGVLEQEGALDVRQVPVLATSGLVEGHHPDDICRVGVFGSSFVAVLPAHTMRVFGIAAPATAIAGATELTRVDGEQLGMNEIAVGAVEGGAQSRVAVHLFVQRDISLWRAGTYRFHTETPDGEPQFAYACLVPPALLDGSWTAIRP